MRPAFLSWAISNLPMLQLSSPHLLLPHTCSVHLTLNFRLILLTTSWTAMMIINVSKDRTVSLPSSEWALPEFSVHETSILDFPHLCCPCSPSNEVPASSWILLLLANTASALGLALFTAWLHACRPSFQPHWGLSKATSSKVDSMEAVSRRLKRKWSGEKLYDSQWPEGVNTTPKRKCDSKAQYKQWREKSLQSQKVV